MWWSKVILAGLIMIVALLGQVAPAKECRNKGKVVCHKMKVVTVAYRDCSGRRRRDIAWRTPTLRPTECPLKERQVERKYKVYERVLDVGVSTFETPTFPKVEHEKIVCRVKVCGSSAENRFRVEITDQFVTPDKFLAYVCLKVKGFGYQCNRNRLPLPVETKRNKLVVELKMETRKMTTPVSLEGGIRGYYVQLNPNKPFDGLGQASVTVDNITGETKLVCNDTDFGAKKPVTLCSPLTNTGTEKKVKREIDREKIDRKKQLIEQIFKYLNPSEPLLPNEEPMQEPVTSSSVAAATTSPTPTVTPNPTSATSSAVLTTTSHPTLDCAKPADENNGTGHHTSSSVATATPSPTPTVTPIPTSATSSAVLTKTSHTTVNRAKPADENNGEDDDDDAFFDSDEDFSEDPCDLLPACPFKRRRTRSYSTRRIFFNIESGECERIYLRAAEAKLCDSMPEPKNYFRNPPSCQRKCTNVCLLPMSQGFGRFPQKRYFFDGSRCKHFRYGGSGGTANNFETSHQCEMQCGRTDLDPVIVAALKEVTKNPDKADDYMSNPKTKCLVKKMST